MTTTVYKVRALCHDVIDDTIIYQHLLWTDDVASINTCPDHNVDHVWYENTVLQSVAPNQQMIIDDITHTGGRYRAMGVPFEVPGGNTGVFAEVGSYSKKYDVRVHSVTIYAGEENIGDFLHFYVRPPTPIGYLTTTGTSGTTGITASATVIANVQVGYGIILGAGTGSQDVGEILAIDSNTSTLTLENPLNYDFNPYTPVSIYIKRLENIALRTTGRMTFGENTAGSALVPAGIQGVLIYKNMTGLPKTLFFAADVLY